MERTKINIFEGNQKTNFRRKPKYKFLEGNQKFWKENKIEFEKETKKIGWEFLTPLAHRTNQMSTRRKLKD